MSDLAKRSGDLVSLLEKMKPAIAQALPKHVSAERVARIALTAVRSNYKLAQCTPQSFLGSLLQASQLGLEVNTPLGHAYLIPYKDGKSGKLISTLVIGYQGMLDLARRSGMVKAIYAYPVFDGDAFDYELGLEPKLKHKPCERPGELTHVYAVARLTDGEPIFTVLSRNDVEGYRQRSRAKDDGPWVTDYTAMALKTSIRRLYRWLPKSAEQAMAISVDEAAERDEPQVDAFSPEIAGLLSDIPADPAPSPVTEGTPEGRRIRVGAKTKGAAAAREANQASPPPPAASAPAAAPADLEAPINVEHLAQMLGEVDEAWADEAYPDKIIAKWTEAQRRAAHAWAEAVLGDGPMDQQANRPPHTRIGREPGDD